MDMERKRFKYKLILGNSKNDTADKLCASCCMTP